MNENKNKYTSGDSAYANPTDLSTIIRASGLMITRMHRLPQGVAGPVLRSGECLFRENKSLAGPVRRRGDSGKGGGVDTNDEGEERLRGKGGRGGGRGLENE